jgi:hypothetical protein
MHINSVPLYQLSYRGIDSENINRNVIAFVEILNLHGGGGETRTRNLGIKSPLLWPLSYTPGGIHLLLAPQSLMGFAMRSCF